MMVKRLESYVRKTRARLVQYIPDAAELQSATWHGAAYRLIVVVYSLNTQISLSY